MKKTAWVIIGIIVIIGVIKLVPKNSTSNPVSDRAYSSEKYGISFTYPENYVLTENEVGTPERGHYSIVLVKKEDTAPRVNGEGPSAITFDIFQNNIDKESLPTWFHNSSASNSKLTPNQTYASTTIAGKEAINYRWSGLYEGETIAFAHNDNIVMMSVTSISPDDKNIPVFRQITSSLKTQ